MYARMGINTILALLTTRYALQALGVTDFGLFAVLGSIISFMGVFNTIMLSTSNRFIAVAIGRGEDKEINKVFNINLIIFIGCAIILLIIGLPLGEWYVRKYINYDGPIETVLMVFYLSLIGSVISTIATPYNGLIMAKERFLIFSLVDVAIHIVRFIVAILLVNYFSKKLLIYTISQSLTIALPTILYYIYCKIEFPKIVKFKIVKDSKSYKDIFKFSGWVAYGAVASVVRNQAAALLVNHFFSTIVNAALGIANSLNTYVMMFANNLTQPMQPQITKSYAAGNYERTDELLIMSTKFSFLLMLFIGAPFFVGAEWIMGLWLGDVPAYAVSFTILLIIDNLITSFNSGLSLVLFADGRIAIYQIIVNTLRLIAVVVAFFVLKSGATPNSLFYTYIIFSLLIVIATQWCLHYTLKYDNKKLIRKSYIPSLTVLIVFIPILFLPESIHVLVRIAISMLYLSLVEIFIGLNIKERQYIFQFIFSKK